MQTLREYSEKISDMWLYESNGTDTPDTVTAGSAKIFWWKCLKNPKHVFQKDVHRMFNKKGMPIGCIYCEAEHPLPFPGETDLFSICPKAKTMWDYKMNIGFDINRIHPGTPEKAWFVCEEEQHSFSRDICRFAKNQECPICRKYKNVIAKFPHMVKQWDFKKNIETDINLTSSNSKDLVWWKCKKCAYEWQAQIFTRRISKGECPCCETRIIVRKGVTDLLTLIPDFKHEYNFDKNESIDVYSLSVSDNTPVWWKCKSGHEWYVSPNARIKTINKEYIVSKCPYCQGVRRLTSYADEYPDLIPLFMKSKNNCSLDEVTADQRQDIFWWHCPTCDNDFESSIHAMIRSLTSSNKGCSYCAGKKVKRETSFAYLHSEVMDEYDPDNKVNPYNVVEKSLKRVKWICRNNPEHRWECDFRQRAVGRGNCPECRGWHYNMMLWEERPDLEKYYDVNKNTRNFNSYSYKSNEKVWWICENGHSFNSAIHHMCTRDNLSCPICMNRTLEVGINDLESQFPDLAIEFNSEKNRILPKKIIYISSKEYWWRCKEGHEFIRTPYYRTSRCSDCPVCSRTQIVKGINDFQNVYPDITEIWDYEKNEERPDEISDRNRGKYYFKCKSGHEYESYLSTEIFNNYQCLVCNNVLIQIGINSLLDTHSDLADEFSPSEVRKPTEFTKDMSYSILWRCPTCSGDYHYPIKDRELHDSSCPYCNKNHVLINFNSLVDTDSDLIKEWSPNNERGPETYCKSYKIYVKWICPKCNGEYSAKISEREVDDDSCPYCNNKKPLPGKNTLADTHKELAAEWSPNNINTPYDVIKEYRYSVKWICKVCNGEYNAKINEREIGDDACPYCNKNRPLLGLNSLVDTHQDLIKEWSSSNNRGPETYIKDTKKYVKWTCLKCHGDYWAKINEREVGDDACPYCKDITVLPNFNSFKVKHDDLLSEWDFVNNYLICDPNYISDKYAKNVWWICNKNKHRYLLSPNQRIYYQKRKQESCPYCKGMRQKKKYYL